MVFAISEPKPRVPSPLQKLIYFKELQQIVWVFQNPPQQSATPDPRGTNKNREGFSDSSASQMKLHVCGFKPENNRLILPVKIGMHKKCTVQFRTSH